MLFQASGPKVGVGPDVGVTVGVSLAAGVEVGSGLGVREGADVGATDEVVGDGGWTVRVGKTTVWVGVGKVCVALQADRPINKRTVKIQFR